MLSFGAYGEVKFGGQETSGGCTPSTPSPRGTSAPWSPSAAPTSSACRSVEGTGELKLVSPEEYAEAQVFFG